MVKTTTQRRSRKYFAPQNEGVKHKCDHPGCEKAGEFRAPKDRSLKTYYWFCLEHVEEYNRQWNYYADEGDAAEQETFHQRTKFGGFHSRIKYRFGCDLDEELAYLRGFTDFKKAEQSVYFSREDRAEMEKFNLTAETFSIEKLKKRYKKLAKACHPDLHPKDKEAEEKFKRLTAAYKKLLEKLS